MTVQSDVWSAEYGGVGGEPLTGGSFRERKAAGNSLVKPDANMIAKRMFPGVVGRGRVGIPENATPTSWISNAPDGEPWTGASSKRTLKNASLSSSWATDR